jgi:hypothetical protein
MKDKISIFFRITEPLATPRRFVKIFLFPLPLDQGGPTFFFPLAKNSFPVAP